jgi:hypothetical protein
MKRRKETFEFPDSNLLGCSTISTYIIPLSTGECYLDIQDGEMEL